jgi:predicted ATPase/DNA-binding SARP family transcriptional activator
MLLAYLAVKGDWVGRDELSGIIWPEASVGTRLTRLRQMLPYLEARGWSPDLEVERLRVRWSRGSDVHRLMLAHREARWLDLLEEDRGPLLSGLDADSEPFALWLESARQMLRSTWSEAAPHAATALESERRVSEALEVWSKVLREDGLAEVALCELMRLCLAGDQPARGLQEFSAFQQRLWSAFALKPQASTVAWMERLRQARAGTVDTLNSPSLPIVDAPTEPGEVLNPFFGRESELNELLAWLEDPSSEQVLTILGPGGVGKTRLASEFVEQSRWQSVVVPLVNVSPGQTVATAVAVALGTPVRDLKEPAVEVHGQLLHRRILLVLDNAEHLTDEIRALQQVLHDLTDVRLLVTSRVRLDLSEERLLRLEGLPVAADGLALDGLAFEDSAAVRLFWHAVRRARPGSVWSDQEVALAMRICQLLAGIPLALELAGAWAKVFGLSQIAAQLEGGLDFLEGSNTDLDLRHQGLRIVFDQSWRLLHEDERRALAALCIFRGGFEVMAALEVAEVSHRQLLALVDKSLLRIVGDQVRRGEIHPLIQEYAREHLEAHRPSLLERHAQYFLGFIEETAPKLRGSDQAFWLERVDQEHENLRLALATLFELDASAALRLAGAMHWFWYVRGHYREGLDWLDCCLAVADPKTPVAVQANALRCAGALATDLGEYERGQALLQTALERFQEADQALGAAHTRHHLGLVTRAQGDLEHSRQHLEGSIEAHRKLGDVDWLATSLNDLAITTSSLGDNERAEVLFQESLKLKELVGDQMGVAYALHNLAVIAFHLGRPFETTKPLYERSLAIKRSLRDRHGEATTLNNLAEGARMAGDLGLCRTYLGQAISMFNELGHHSKLMHTLAYFVRLMAQEGSLERAMTLWGAVQVLMERSGLHLAPSLIEELSKLQQQAKDDLGVARVELALESGRALSMAQAVTLPQDTAPF